MISRYWADSDGNPDTEGKLVMIRTTDLRNNHRHVVQLTRKFSDVTKKWTYNLKMCKPENTADSAYESGKCDDGHDLLLRQ